VPMYRLPNILLSVSVLTSLSVLGLCGFEEIEFNTPNLVLFANHCDEYWPVKLRRFLDKKNGFKVLNLYISAMYSQGFTDLEKLKTIEMPPYELNHVELQLHTLEESSAHVAFVNAVLWCCRPRSLTLRSSVPFEEQIDVVKFACKKLLEQEDQGHTNIQIVSPSSPEAHKHLLELNALSMASVYGGETISFIKEEGEGVEVISEN
ncbi:hypothetical protein M8C21_012189, partial [Ambrosia artemisiifolia]